MTALQGLSNGAMANSSPDSLLKRVSLKRLKVLSNNRDVSSDESGTKFPALAMHQPLNSSG